MKEIHEKKYMEPFSLPAVYIAIIVFRRYLLPLSVPDVHQSVPDVHQSVPDVHFFKQVLNRFIYRLRVAEL